MPDVAIVAEFRRGAIGADERMRHSPDTAFELTESLREPAREGEVIELFEGMFVFVPEFFCGV